jgi:hypothetical protein
VNFTKAEVVQPAVAALVVGHRRDINEINRREGVEMEDVGLDEV